MAEKNRDHDVNQYFDGESFDAILREMTEAKGAPDRKLFIRSHGDGLIAQVVATGYDGPGINDSHLCPGAPGCP